MPGILTDPTPVALHTLSDNAGVKNGNGKQGSKLVNGSTDVGVGIAGIGINGIQDGHPIHSVLATRSKQFRRSDDQSKTQNGDPNADPAQGPDPPSIAGGTDPTASDPAQPGVGTGEPGSKGTSSSDPPNSNDGTQAPGGKGSTSSDPLVVNGDKGGSDNKDPVPTDPAKPSSGTDPVKPDTGTTEPGGKDDTSTNPPKPVGGTDVDPKPATATAVSADRFLKEYTAARAAVAKDLDTFRGHLDDILRMLDTQIHVEDFEKIFTNNQCARQYNAAIDNRSKTTLAPLMGRDGVLIQSSGSTIEELEALSATDKQAILVALGTTQLHIKDPEKKELNEVLLTRQLRAAVGLPALSINYP